MCGARATGRRRTASRARAQPGWSRPGTPSLHGKRLGRVLDFMDARLVDDISLDDLAREACLSHYHFSRLFHEATGLPPHRYLIERRIKAAPKMLSAERSSIARI